MSISAISADNYSYQTSTDTSQQLKITITQASQNQELDLGWGANFEVLAIVKATEEDFAPYSPYNTYAGSTTGSSQLFYWVAYRFKNNPSDTQSQFKIKSFEVSNDNTNYNVWGREYNEVKPSQVEPFFGVDLNNDGLSNGNTVKTTVSTDTTGTGLKIDADGMHYVSDDGVDYAIMPRMGGSSFSFNNSYGSGSRQAIAVEKVASSSGSNEPEYLLVVKSIDQVNPSGSSASSSSTTEQVSWEVYTLRTAQGWADYANTNTGTTGSTYTGAGTAAPTTPGSNTQQSATPTLYFDWDAARPSSIASYEVAGKLNQNLDDDPAIGIPLQSLVPVSSKTSGIRLEKDDQGALYIVDGTGNSKTAKPIDDISSVQYTWGEGTAWFNSSSVKEVAAVMKGTQLVGYKLAVKKESSYDMYSGAATSTATGNNSQTTYTTWDVLYVDAQNPKINWGQWDSKQNTWVDYNERNLKSIADYEELFGSDLNGDGRQGIDVSTLTPLATDTSGVKLARASDQSLFVLSADGNSAKLVKADWLETSYRMDDNNYNKREAIAVEAIESEGVITGYNLLMKNTNKWSGAQSENVSYDIMQLDANAKLKNGEMKDGIWVNYSTYGIKSLAAYEETFDQDLNGDNYVGVDVSTLTLVSTDTTGIRLAKDASGGLYLVDNSATPSKATVISDAYSLEWSYGTDKREAIAAEAVRSADTITGYKVAVKETRFDYYTQKIETTWDIINLDANGKSDYGASPMASGGQTKSISAYEPDFGQDLNNDGRIGIDTSTLKYVSSDTSGPRLAKDNDGALYIVSTSNSVTQAKPVGNSSWLEYNNTWTGGYSKREAIAVTADESNGTLLGYQIILRNTNSWSGDGTEQKNYDILYLNTNATQQYGSMVNNTWVDKNVYGVKSLLPYEVKFGQDFNGDGVVGIDINTLTPVSTDKLGVRLRRDKENALYLISEGTNQPQAIGNASWLEYSNSWGNGSNSRVAVAIGSTKDTQGNIIGYKLALKNTNTWDSTSNVDWEILSLDSNANITWGTTATAAGGGSIWTNNIRPFETLVGEDLDNDGNIGIDRSSLTTLTTESSSDSVKLAKDSDGLVYILDGDTITLALRDSYGATPMLEFNNTWTNGSSTAVLYAAGKDSVGNYKIAVKLTQTNGSTTQVSWQIHTVSSDGVLNWSQMASVKSPARFETAIGQDLDGDGNIGLAALELTDVSSDTGSFKLQKDSAGQLYIYDDIDSANNHLTYIVDARGGTPNFDVAFNGFASQAWAVHKLADGTYRLAVKKTITTGSVDTVKWDVYSLSARDTTTNEAIIDWSKTAFSKDPLEVERLLNQDINGDGTVASARVAPTTALSTDTSTSVTVGLDAEHYLWIKDASTWKEVKDIYGSAIKLDTTESLADGGSFVSETVAATAISNTSGNDYRIAVKETLTMSATATPSVQWKIYTVASDGTIDLNPVVTSTITPWESGPRFNQDLDGITPIIGEHSSQDPDLAADQLGGIYLVKGEDKLLITDGQDGTPELEYEQAFDGGSIVAKVVSATDDDSAIGNKLLAVEVTTTTQDASSSYWIVHTAQYQDAGTPTDTSDDYYTLDWSSAVITTDMSSYATSFGQEFTQPTAATLGA